MTITTIMIIIILITITHKREKKHPKYIYIYVHFIRPYFFQASVARAQWCNASSRPVAADPPAPRTPRPWWPPCASRRSCPGAGRRSVAGEAGAGNPGGWPRFKGAWDRLGDENCGKSGVKPGKMWEERMKFKINWTIGPLVCHKLEFSVWEL